MKRVVFMCHVKLSAIISFACRLKWVLLVITITSFLEPIHICSPFCFSLSHAHTHLEYHSFQLLKNVVVPFLDVLCQINSVKEVPTSLGKLSLSRMHTYTHTEYFSSFYLELTHIQPNIQVSFTHTQNPVKDDPFWVPSYSYDARLKQRQKSLGHIQLTPTPQKLSSWFQSHTVNMPEQKERRPKWTEVKSRTM